MEKIRTKFEKTKFKAIDAHVGVVIKELRLARGISMKELAPYLGITHRQLHKYEAGKNRIRVGKLFILAKVFQVEFRELFKGLEVTEDFHVIISKKPTSAGTTRGQLMAVRHYTAIDNKKIKESLNGLMKELANIGK